MPLPRIHARDQEVTHVVVESSEYLQTQEVESSRVVPTTRPTTLIPIAQRAAQPEPTILRIRDDHDKDDDDDEKHGPRVVRMGP